MAMNVDFIVNVNPTSLPAAGGAVVVTFQASTDFGASQLQVSYSLSPGAPFTLVGPTSLPPTAVSAIPADYDMGLTLKSTGGAAPFVTIQLAVKEVATGEVFPRSCNVTLGPAAHAPSHRSARR